MFGIYPLVVNLRLRTILSERGGGVTIFKFNTVYIGSGLLLHYTLKVLIECFVTVQIVGSGSTFLPFSARDFTAILIFIKKIKKVMCGYAF